MNKCIFHIPLVLKTDVVSASRLRPQKMLDAFNNIGYEVEIVDGNSEQRKQKIKQIKKKILNGEKYEFLYSESSTMPTALTDKGHLPAHPLIDFSFFGFCRSHNIKVGLFYRDIYWKFATYRQSIPYYKWMPAIFFYKYDLYFYHRVLNKLYIPSKLMYGYLNENFDSIIDVLPSGAEIKKDMAIKQFDFQNLTILYIGALRDPYHLEILFETSYELPFIKLIVCCKRDEWELVKEKYNKYLNEKISIVHESGDGLVEFYRKADLCASYFSPNQYMTFAMPYKITEYLGFLKPIIGTRNTAIGNFIEENHIGWAIDYDKKALSELLSSLFLMPAELKTKQDNCIQSLTKNTWNARAEKVMKDLKEHK